MCLPDWVVRLCLKMSFMQLITVLVVGHTSCAAQTTYTVREFKGSCDQIEASGKNILARQGIHAAGMSQLSS
jgi:hypothetical protein